METGIDELVPALFERKEKSSVHRHPLHHEGRFCHSSHAAVLLQRGGVFNLAGLFEISHETTRQKDNSVSLPTTRCEGHIYGFHLSEDSGNGSSCQSARPERKKAGNSRNCCSFVCALCGNLGLRDWLSGGIRVACNGSTIRGSLSLHPHPETLGRMTSFATCTQAPVLAPCVWAIKRPFGRGTTRSLGELLTMGPWLATTY